MKKVYLALTLFLMLVTYSNCVQSGFEVKLGKKKNILASIAPLLGKNTATVTIGTCSLSNNNMNQACAKVAICTPGTTTCQEIQNVLVDTGSVGLRLFKAQVSIPLSPVTNTNGQEIAECISYSGGATQWGPLKWADVVIGQEPAAKIPIQIVDVDYGTKPADCTNSDVDNSVGFNGILGIGLFTEDCGEGCAQIVSNRFYFNCSGTTCSEASVEIAKQVKNPVAAMPLDNNGVILEFPTIGPDGAVMLDGTLTMGIGTQLNNQPETAVTTYPADQYGNFKTSYNGVVTSDSYIDSGSNAILFPASFPMCTTSTGFYCPTSTQTVTARQMGYNSTPTKDITFSVMNAELATAQSNPNFVFNNIGGSNGSQDFAWGLPFMIGRKVYFGIQGKSTPLGTGPFFAH